MTTHLLDANVLISLTIAEHQHHDAASRWFGSITRAAVCPVVEGALIRFLLRMGESSATAAAILASVRASTRCEFWPDSLSYADVSLATIQGHRQVTDSYLAALAAHHSGRLATFDRALAARRPDVCVLLTD